MNNNSMVGVIIPVRNEALKIKKTIESIALENDTDLFFVVVDDASTDSTAEKVSSVFKKNCIDGIVVENALRQGAGASRNKGLAILNDAEYVLFFDADDRMFPGAIDVLVRIAENAGSDVVIGKYEYVDGHLGFSRGMSKRDEELWEGILGRQYSTTFNLSAHGEFLETVNYPWNKLLRFDFVKRINLQFSNTVVHNDIYAHWFSLLSSNLISIVDCAICKHKVYKNRSQITNIADERRIALFDALNEVDRLFQKNKSWKDKFYKYFLRFKLDLVRWAYGRLEKEYKGMFMETFLSSMENFNLESFYDLAEAYPGIAADYAFMKFGLKGLE